MSRENYSRQLEAALKALAVDILSYSIAGSCWQHFVYVELRDMVIELQRKSL